MMTWHCWHQVYGSYYRKLSKKVQAALAEANAVAEENLSAISTVSQTRASLLVGDALSVCRATLDLRLLQHYRQHSEHQLWLSRTDIVAVCSGST